MTAKAKKKSEPVMTRLNAEELAVLDTLIAGGVGRSRSAVIGWCVRLVETEHGPWLAQLRLAIREVQNIAPPSIKTKEVA